jgi:hypothetical protein
MGGYVRGGAMKQHAGSFVTESPRGGASTIGMINLERIAGFSLNGSPCAEMSSMIWRESEVPEG